MQKKVLILAFSSILIIGFCVCVAMVLTRKPKSSPAKVTVVTTLFPLYDFAKNVGGDKVEVLLLLPPGMEAHAFEPKPSDIVEISESDLFVCTGDFMEPWATDVISGLENSNVKVVNASAGINLKEMDPHIWLDFDNAKTMVGTITKALVEKDPSNASFYQDNFVKYTQELNQLDVKYKKILSTCKNRKVVYGGHYAFGYLMKRYNLQYTAAQGFSPDSEPTAKDLITLVEQIKNGGIKYVFYEELSSPKIAQTLSNEIGAQMLLLNGAHNVAKEDFEKGATFILLMEDNLKNLAIGLDCAN